MKPGMLHFQYERMLQMANFARYYQGRALLSTHDKHLLRMIKQLLQELQNPKGDVYSVMQTKAAGGVHAVARYLTMRGDIDLSLTGPDGIEVDHYSLFVHEHYSDNFYTAVFEDVLGYTDAKRKLALDYVQGTSKTALENEKPTTHDMMHVARVFYLQYIMTETANGLKTRTIK